MSNLVASRQIVVFNQAKQTYATFETTSSNWSEIVSLIEGNPELGVSDIKKMRAVLHSSQHTLELPNATVPEGAQKIFLFEAKVKSGATKKAPVSKTSEYDAMGYNDLRKLAAQKKDQLAQMGIVFGSKVTKDELIAGLEKLSGVNVEKQTKTAPISGKTKEVIVKKEETVEAKQNIAKDKELLNNQPSLEERISSLETTLASFILGVFKLASNYVSGRPLPVAEVSKVISSPTKRKNFEEESVRNSFDQEELDLAKLQREASSLKL